MNDGNSVINLGGLAKPATVLIEKVCNAVGVVFEPTRARRMARAEVDVERTRALARVELCSALEERALERFVLQEARKQGIIEAITAQAASALPPNAKPTALDEDWIAHFFRQCDTVSDKEMQSLWARLLAGEATTPGTFSKRTVDFVSTIDKRDAELFSSLCQFAWCIDDPVLIIHDFNDGIYAEHGINFDTLTHLDSIGLIAFDGLAGFQKTQLGRVTEASYYGRSMAIEFDSQSNNKLSVGHAIFTGTGLELYPICGSICNEEFCEFIVNRWLEGGIAVSSHLRPRQRT